MDTHLPMKKFKYSYLYGYETEIRASFHPRGQGWGAIPDPHLAQSSPVDIVTPFLFSPNSIRRSLQ